MARPRLYHTAEEQRAANRAKSKRHYHKEKSAIQERRRTGQQGPKRVHTSGTDAPEHKYYRKESKEASKGSAIATKITLRRSSPLTYWLERVERLDTKLAAFFGNLPRRQYVDNVVKKFLATGNKDVFRDEIVKLGNLQKFGQRYEAEILQLVGVGKELEKVSMLERDISSIIHWFEELICLAMVDMSEFTETYCKSKFDFQLVN